MAVPTNTQYDKIADLKYELSALYKKLTSVNDDKFNSLTTAFMYDPLSTPEHTPNTATDLTIKPVQATPDTYKSTVSHFQNLLKDALYCQIEPNVIGDGTISDNNKNMSGLLKFVKGPGSVIPIGTVAVYHEEKIMFNIISSVNLINTFLEILDSYAQYVKTEKDNAINDINNIFIVGVDPIKGNSATRYRYLEASSDVSGLKPRFTALYLKINPNNYGIVRGTTMEVDTKYDGNSNIKDHSIEQSIAVFDTSDSLLLKNPTTSTNGYIRGLRIRKSGQDSIIDEMNAAKDAITTPALNFANGTEFKDSNAASPYIIDNLRKRDQYLLKHFLNIIINIKKESRYTTIKILQTYYTIMKILLLTAINAGNHLYNSKFKSVAVLHNGTSTTDSTLLGLKGIEVDNFGPPPNPSDFLIIGSYADISMQDTNFDAKITELIKKITTDSANNIGVGTTLPVLSDGFYAEKIDEKHIEISAKTINKADKYDIDLLEWSVTDSFNKSRISDMDILKDFNNNDFLNIKNKYKININGGRYNIVEIYNTGDVFKFKIRASLSDPSLYPKDADNFKDKSKYNILDLNEGKYSKSPSQEDIGNALYAIFKKGGSGTTINKVKLVVTTPEDNAEEYNDLKSEIVGYSENIKLNKSKINNNTTLYALHKSKHNVLNTQLITYYIIIAILIGIIVAINLANIERSFIKTIATGCFGAVILLYISYYIMNVVYINEEFTVEHFDSAFASSEPASITEEYESGAKNAKKAFVQGRMDNYCAAIILALKILKPSLENSSLIDSSTELLRIGKNESTQRLYINNILINKRDNSEISIDVLKYENMNFAVHIKALLITATILIGVYTLHLYIDRKYLDLLIFITAILLICAFTYFIVYSNKIVRTTSSNNYWGKEYDDQYT